MPRLGILEALFSTSSLTIKTDYSSYEAFYGKMSATLAGRA